MDEQQSGRVVLDASGGALPPGIHRDLGLTDDELSSIRAALERDPTYEELAMFSVMWSEHCSYKSSKRYLATLPTQGDAVRVGPGEGAGIVEVAPGTLVAWKVESHNHPSFVEPFNGAATGVGGIVRDILSMGARPIALLDSLRFGPPDDPTTRLLVEGVVHGISSYGNSIGVPTVGGETKFEECYGENPLVNVACLGVVEGDLMHGRAEGPGNVVVLYGSRTGRDGIGGASVLASATFDAESDDKRPSVQVGDPFTEKLVIEVTLELVRRGLIVGLQDLGAGGLSCPASEMVAKAGTGMRVDLDRVHLRERGMEPFEVLISESQERMMAIVPPEHLEEALAVCARWGVIAEVVGEVTDSGRVEVESRGRRVADVPARALAEGPSLDRAVERPPWIEDLWADDPGEDPPDDAASALLRLLASPNICSKRWIWEQYDHMIFLGTLRGPGEDAAVIRLPSRQVAVAITVDGAGRFCQLDPYEGARLTVAAAARKIACAGATPIAVTNCLNFGSPEKPEVMWQFAEVVRGLREACDAFGTPVTGGNVSFYNETSGRSIFPTPVIGMLGVLESVESSVGNSFRSEGSKIVLLGSLEHGEFGGSEFAKVVHDRVAGRPPRLDIEREKSLHATLLDANRRHLLRAAHHVGAGGVAVALAVAACRGGGGLRVTLEGAMPHQALFGEAPSRAVVACADGDEGAVVEIARRQGIEASVVGVVEGDGLDFGNFSVPLDVASKAWEGALEGALSATIGTLP